MPWSRKRSERLSAHARTKSTPYRLRRKVSKARPKARGAALQIQDRTDDYFRLLSVLTTNTPTGPTPIYQSFLHQPKTTSEPQTRDSDELRRNYWGDSLVDERAIGALFREIKKALEKGKTRSALMHLFRSVDDMLTTGDFQTCNALLSVSDLEQLPVELLVGLLRITFPAHDKLSQWQVAFERIEDHLRESGRDPATLLAGLPRGE